MISLNTNVGVSVITPLPQPGVINFTATVRMPTAAMGYQLRPITMRSITQDVAKIYGLTLEQMRGPQRARRVSHPRQEAMWRMCQDGRWSLPQIGRFLGRRDHTTIIHGRRAHQKRLDAGALVVTRIAAE